MTTHPSARVQNVSEIASDHLTDILGCFKPGRKITLLVRSPEKPDGSQDFVLTTDDLNEVIAALRLRLDPNVQTVYGDVVGVGT